MTFQGRVGDSAQDKSQGTQFRKTPNPHKEEVATTFDMKFTSKSRQSSQKDIIKITCLQVLYAGQAAVSQ